MKNINTNIGKNIKYLRLLNGLSKEKVGKSIGVCGYQIAKYENAKTSVSIEKLLMFCNLFNVEIQFFIGEFYKEEDLNEWSSSAILSLVKNYNKIKSTKLKNSVLSLVREISKYEESNG